MKDWVSESSCWYCILLNKKLEIIANYLGKNKSLISYYKLKMLKNYEANQIVKHTIYQDTQKMQI